ncbi:hypothetical protein T8J41_01530 [Nitratireductor rhodophyticola]|uniref:Uncharacterized membrane protein n=2 Tax=Nitratireductor aquibiodomus TaxID=204799 RepID=A0A1H4MAN1_9HYPH|nr:MULTISPECIES: hypothetical protein [Nitratireductor]EIM73178.1 hypothetical protein A33O_16999 [Nitratireductor aquibiodomus RA22]MEC9245793.1 hypothetical protein [Pseudomonadota bacterium]WPZ14540.1 hypothetical protein T8J41_01530 [Nitratireductor rhodophyticola]SEB79804.1 Uncharacterized membrane protein [Nitratireductor aquibiodomus]
MSDMQQTPDETRKTDRWLEPGPTNIQVIYILYLVGFVIGISALVGIVIAYMNRGKASGWLETHYTWAIRTFWIGVLFGFVSALLMVVGIGFLLMIAVAIWVVVRCVIGLQAVGRNEPIKNPQSWLI